MKKQIIYILLSFICGASFLISCECSQGKDVPYELAKGYYMYVDVKDEDVPTKICSHDELVKYFGFATVLGLKHKPTIIDFSRNFVIPIVYPVTDRDTKILIDRFVRSSPDEIFLDVKIWQDTVSHSFTIRPFQLVIVDNRYKDKNLRVSIGAK